MSDRTTVEKLVQQTRALLSFPPVCLRILELTSDETGGMREIAEVLQQDPALTLKILRIANSSWYSIPSPVTSVMQAVSMIGTRRVRDLVLASSVVKVCSSLQNDLVSLDNFWQHCIYTALAARLLQRQRKNQNDETLFAAGLLHDIGQLVMFNQLPEGSRDALIMSLENPETPEIFQAEQAIFGFDHAEVGAALMSAWGLPQVFIDTARYHHEPELAQENLHEVSLIHIANSLAYFAELEVLDLDNAPSISPFAWRTTQLHIAIAEPTVTVMQQDLREIQSWLFAEKSAA